EWVERVDRSGTGLSCVRVMGMYYDYNAAGRPKRQSQSPTLLAVIDRDGRLWPTTYWNQTMWSGSNAVGHRHAHRSMLRVLELMEHGMGTWIDKLCQWSQRCCFCSHPLRQGRTSRGRINVAYGPMCAKRFGLNSY